MLLTKSLSGQTEKKLHATCARADPVGTGSAERKAWAMRLGPPRKRSTCQLRATP